MSAHATVRELSELVDRQLDDRRRRLVEDHLASCGGCRERLAGLRRIAAGLGSLPPLEPPAELGRRVELGVRRVASRVSWNERIEEGLRRSLIQPVLLPVLAVILALTVILYVFSEGLARREQRGFTRLIIESGAAEVAEPAAEAGESPAAAAEDVAGGLGAAGPGRVVAGRSFDRVDGVWVERGLAGAAPTARFDLTGRRAPRPEGAGPAGTAELSGPAAPAAAEPDPRLAPFAVLGGPVRLELDGVVVEAIFPPTRDQPPDSR